jgi:indolepyruvate decarboxylase
VPLALSTIAHREFDTIVFVLNNQGYATERQLLNGSFNDVANWKYHRIIEMLDKGSSFEVTTEEELVQAVDYALQSGELTVINVVVEPDDISPVLKRITEGLGKNI